MTATAAPFKQILTRNKSRFRIADSFESWARDAVTAFEKNEDLYSKADDDVYRAWRGARAKNKKWWQFWR